MGTGNPGKLPISFPIPDYICGEEVLHTRFVYLCPVANGWWPTQVAIHMTPRIHMVFPACPVPPVAPLGQVVWIHGPPVAPP